MKRFAVLIVTICLAAAAGIVPCLVGPAPTAAVGHSPDVYEQVTDLVVTPLATAVFLLLGMVLLISEMAASSTHRVIGIAGSLCLALVLTSHVLAGIAPVVGVALVLAGLGLILVEAHLARGYAVSVTAGVACEFAGLYLTLSAAGVIYALCMSAVVTFLSIMAFLAYLPRSEAWRALGCRLSVSTGSLTVRKVEGEIQLATESGHLAPSAEADALEDRKRRAEDALSRLKADLGRTTPKSDDDQQIVRGDGGNG